MAALLPRELTRLIAGLPPMRIRALSGSNE